MNLKEDIIQYLQSNNIDTSRLRVKYFAKSPYQARRYKPEYVEQECWIYPLSAVETKVIQAGPMRDHKITTCGLLVTQSDWADEDFRDMVIDDARRLANSL